VLEVKNEGGAAVRIFVDQQTHLPLMLQYTEVRPRIMIDGRGRGGGRGPGGPPPGRGGDPEQRPDREEMRRRMEQMPPPAPSNVSLYLADYQTVEGVMLPHRLTYSVDGKPVEEWTIEKARINPALNADFFEKK
jgi:hypothetical protein